ncbi:hypothetical protein [Micromonospora sp. 050-3]|uniref:hypothetical protein n=1 Tax=Micromonospora sp. 050-3 TaxID=2789265 RepID=UPI003979FFA7
MPSINWDTVATSAVTALLVTLAVEYAAKPRLEARKERILGALRSRRELSAAITSIALPAAFLCIDMPKDVTGETRDSLLAERKRQYERLRDQAQVFVDSMDRHAGTFAGPPMKLVMSYIGTVQGVMLSSRTRHEKARLIHDLSKQIAMILDGRWWQTPARVRAMWELDRLVKRSQDQGGDEEPVSERREIASAT